MEDHEHKKPKTSEHIAPHDHEECQKELEPSLQSCTSCELKSSCGCAVENDSCNTCGDSHDTRKKDWRLLIAAGTMIGISIFLRQTSISSIISNLLLAFTMIIVGYPLANSGLKGLRKGSIGINLLVTIAAIGATLIGEFEEGALVVFLFSISLRLEEVATERARQAIEGLMKLRPEVATIRRNGDEITVPVEQVIPGEVFLVKPGDRIPLDGIVLEGETTVDQATITGESVPIEKGYMDDVFAGTINLDGFLAVETKRASRETMLANILRLVQEAETRKSPTETFVSKFARYYTPLIIFFAALIALVPSLFFNAPLLPSVYNSLVLLVIGCPCALTIATPVAMVSAITSASRNGVLIKGSTFIEEMNKANVISFDKTGTLTSGQLQVVEIIPYGVTIEKVLSIAAALEEKSKHPIALAINQRVKDDDLPIENVTDFKSQTGRGVEANIRGKIFRIGSQRYFEELGTQLEPRDLEKLQAQGNTVVLVSE
ncbi:MAG: heavy metal translocating P-type ATPase, partial [Promethearchaeota archaeon]